MLSIRLFLIWDIFNKMGLSNFIERIVPNLSFGMGKKQPTFQIENMIFVFHPCKPETERQHNISMSQNRQRLFYNHGNWYVLLSNLLDLKASSVKSKAVCPLQLCQLPMSPAMIRWGSNFTMLRDDCVTTYNLHNKNIIKNRVSRHHWIPSETKIQQFFF